MAFGIIDLVCGVIILLFAILGAFKGFAKQVIKMLSGIVVLVGSFLLLKPVFDYLTVQKTIGKKWSELSSKDLQVYVPLLQAFMNEIKRSNPRYCKRETTI